MHPMRPERPNRPRADRIGWAVLAAISIPVSLMFAVSAAFLGDAPGAGGTWTYLFAVGLLATPVMALITFVLTVIAAIRNTRQSDSFVLAPALFWLAYMVVAFSGLGVFCGGQFACR